MSHLLLSFAQDLRTGDRLGAPVRQPAHQVRKLGKQRQLRAYLSHCLNSLKRGYIGDYIGDYYKGYEGGY